MASIEDVFDIDPDRYTCISLDCNKYQGVTDEEFQQKLTVSLDYWKRTKIVCVVVKIPIEQSTIIPICVKLGFTFHHAQQTYVLMQQWLSTDQPVNKYPTYAHHYIGAGGFVVNDKQQVLVVKENMGPGQKMRGWKLPGGYVERGEDIGAAAEREVQEETGVLCDFQSLVAFRHQHKYRFGCSDIYFVCLMKAKTEEIKLCNHEIADGRWMDIEEYASHPDVHAINQFFAQQYLKNVKDGKSFIACTPVPSTYIKNSTTMIYLSESSAT